MYIYESHMGGLYTTIDYQEDTYCETCGDSDQLIGTADTPEEAWKLLEPMTATFDDAICETCPHNKDYDYCETQCEGWEKSGGYSLCYVMNFLSEEFEGMDMVYLIANYEDKDQENSGILANGKVSGQKFGDRHALPCVACVDAQYADMLARSLRMFCDDFICDDIKLVTSKKMNEHTVYVYAAEAKASDHKPEGAWYCDDGWWAFFHRDILIPATKEMETVLDLYDAFREKEKNQLEGRKDAGN